MPFYSFQSWMFNFANYLGTQELQIYQSLIIHHRLLHQEFPAVSWIIWSALARFCNWYVFSDWWKLCVIFNERLFQHIQTCHTVGYYISQEQGRIKLLTRDKVHEKVAAICFVWVGELFRCSSLDLAVSILLKTEMARITQALAPTSIGIVITHTWKVLSLSYSVLYNVHTLSGYSILTC